MCYSDFMHNHQKLEMTGMFLNLGTDTQTIVHPFNGPHSAIKGNN